MPRVTIAQLTAQLEEAQQTIAAITSGSNPATPDHRTSEPHGGSYLAGATLWRVVLPASGDRTEACFGVYVRDGFAIQAPPIARWMIGQSWDEKILPWLRSKNAVGRALEPGERLNI
jgi:hypothetical protein